MASQTKQFVSCSFCNKSAADRKLYMCIDEDCDEFGTIYCKRCGIISHEENDHKFDGDSIKKVCLDIIKKDIKGGENKVRSILTTDDEQRYGRVRQVYFGAITAIPSSGQAMLSYTGMTIKEAAQGISNSFKNMSSGTMMGATTDAAVDVATKVQTANSAVDVATKTLNTLQSVAPKAAIGAGIGAAVMAGFEVVLHSYRYYNGDIETFDEYKYHLVKGMSAAIGMGIGNFTGTCIGATVGSLVGPIGTLIGGLIGGIIGSTVGAASGRAIHGKFSGDYFIYKKQKKKEEYVRDALRLFGWMNIDVITDDTKFNEREITKRYRTLAKQYHPDKNNNSPESHADFHTLNVSLGCLLSLLNKNDKKSAVQQLEQVKAIAFTKNIEFITKQLKKKRLLYIVDICIEFDADLTLQALSQYKRNDLLELIDDINTDEGNQRQSRINVVKKNKFASIVAKDSYNNN